jgi:hypothetical protein
MAAKKNTQHYIDNKKFYEELVKYRNALDEAKADGAKEPRQSEYLGRCFQLIAKKFALNKNFNAYPFRDDMESEAILHCIKYAKNFDPSKTSSPLAYFTQFCYHAFLQTIAKEKRYLYTKYKLIENTEIFDHVSDTQDGDTGDYKKTTDYSEGAREKMNEFVETYEKKKAEKSK